MFFVCLFAIFFVIVFSFLLTRKRNYSLLVYIVGIWTASSLFSIIYYVEQPKRYLDIELIPYLFFILCLAISLSPFVIDSKKLNTPYIQNVTLFRQYVFFIGLISLLPFVENLWHVISSYGTAHSDSLSDIYSDKMSGGLDKQKFINWFSVPGRIGNAINVKFQYSSLFLFFLYMGQPVIKKTPLLLLAIAALNPILFQLGLSGRATLVFSVLNAIFLFLIVRNTIPMKIKKAFVFYASIILIFGVILFFILTLSRYNNEKGANSVSLLGWIALYAGEGTLNFNQYMWNTAAFTQGDNCFSFFKNLLGLDTFTDILSRRAYWGPKTGINPARFYTFIGDMFSDLSFFILPVLSFVALGLKKIISNKEHINILKLYILYCWGYLCITGITCYTYKTMTSMTDLLTGFAVIAIFGLKLSCKR